MVYVQTIDNRHWALNPMAVREVAEDDGYCLIVLASGRQMQVKGSWEVVHNAIWPR